MATKTKRWIVTASADRPLREIVKDLGGAGLRGVKVFEHIGAVTGTATEAAVKKLRKVRGVADVSADEPVDIGPPGSPKTW